jgi:hypothetical protein
VTANPFGWWRGLDLKQRGKLCLRLQGESSVRRWGVDGRGRGARGGRARVEGVDVTSALLRSGDESLGPLTGA